MSWVKKRPAADVYCQPQPVDADEFGAGYVNNWDQFRFAADLKAMAEKVGFDGDYFLCRDHGGPWQRDKERKDHIPEAEAMALARRSYQVDMDAGFDLLHIDPTKTRMSSVKSLISNWC